MDYHPKDRAGNATAYKTMTVLEIARAMLEGSGWLVQIHSGRGDYVVAYYMAQSDSVLGQIETLADSIDCSVVVSDTDRVLVFVERSRSDSAFAVHLPILKLPD